MPDVVLKIRTDSAEAIAKLKEFSVQTERAFKGTKVQVNDLTDATKKGTLGLHDLADQGFDKLTDEALPGFGKAMNLVARHMGTVGLGMGALVASGVLLVRHLQAESKAWDELSERIAETTRTLADQRRLGALTQQMAARGAEIQSLTGEPGATREGRLATARIEQARDESRKIIEIAGAELDKKIEIAEKAAKESRLVGAAALTDLLGLSSVRERAELESARVRALAEREYIQKSTDAHQQRNLTIQKLEDDRLKAQRAAGDKWLDDEIGRIKAVEDAERALVRARSAATAETAIGAAERGGDPVAKARAQYAQQTEALRQSLEDQIQAQADKLEKGAILDTDFFRRRGELIATAAEQQANLTAQFVRDEQTGFAAIDTSARALFEKLGPGFEDLTEKLALSEAAEASRQSFQTIEASFNSGRASASEAAEAVRRVTENLLAQGIKIDDLARIVPQQLQSMSGLFRGMSVEIEGTARQVGGIQTVMDQLSPQPIATLTDGWYEAAKAANAYKIQVMEIARMGPMTPRAGMTVSPGPQAVTPQAGQVSAQALAAQIADDQRRGLY